MCMKMLRPVILITLALSPYCAAHAAEIAIDCKLIQQSSPSADGSAGAANAVENWRVDDTTSPVTIELLGQYCDRVKAGVERVDVIVDCPIWR